MDIKAKYKIGDIVKVRADKKIITTCPFCEGKGFKMIDDFDNEGNPSKEKDIVKIVKEMDNMKLVQIKLK